MNKFIYIFLLLSVILIFYNYTFEGVDFETALSGSNLEKILNQNTWTNKQIFSDNINANKNICIGNDCNTALSGNNLCIGGTCINENHLKILNGKKSIYLYKPNDGNNYLYMDNGIRQGNSDDNNDQKKRNGTWLLSQDIPQKNTSCNSLTTDSSCIP